MIQCNGYVFYDNQGISSTKIKKRDEELNLESVGKAAGFVSGIVRLLKKDKKDSQGK